MQKVQLIICLKKHQRFKLLKIKYVQLKIIQYTNKAEKYGLLVLWEINQSKNNNQNH